MPCLKPTGAATNPTTVAANIHLPRRELFLKFLGTLDSIAKEAGHTIGQLAVAVDAAPPGSDQRHRRRPPPRSNHRDRPSR